MIRFRLRASSALALMAAACIAMPATAPAATTADSSAARQPVASGTSATVTSNLWIYPAIRGYGGVRPRPDLPSELSPDVDYKVIVDVVHGDANHGHVLGSLVRLARLVNLMAYAGIPRDHVHLAAVIEGQAGFAAFTNAAYRKRFNVDNPNLALLHELKSSGVELMVCAQALAENDLKDGDISPDVTVTLSALTDFVVYGKRGYSFMQL